MHTARGAGRLLLGLILALPGRPQTVVAAISSAQFEEPLVATIPTSRTEDEALVKALQAYKGQTSPDDFRVFHALLAEYPDSGWRVALLTNLGLAYYHYG